MKQFSMDIPDETDRNRQFAEAPESIAHRSHVIDDLMRVTWTTRRENACLGGQYILEGTLRALDLAGEYGLLPYIHEDEEVGIGQRLDGTIQPTQGTVGIG